ncbi:cysteine proteinase [Pluteus cervinus]|uniref:Cysteine proteinase n=1 Tax=Pluteus cervinus TaxID=181527 RepID=A0ACD3B1L8_9AGAR|nr:cysteine proteinase [Pluteus cervinus]
MPGVTAVPNSPGVGSFGGIHASSEKGISTAYEKMSVKDIKQRAMETVDKELRGGTSALNLMRTARSQCLHGKDCEGRGNLQGALSAFVRSAKLVQLVMNTPEWKQEGGKGVLRKEVSEFFEGEGRDLTERTNSVEEKLKEIESRTDSEAGSSTQSGGSIADRLRALRENGLDAQPKRPAHTSANLPTPPTSPTRVPSQQTSGQHTAPSFSSASTSASGPPQHAFVPASAFGPPSPTSSPSNSPQSPIFNLMQDFNQAFPSIEEIDNHPAFMLPSVPTTKPTAKDASQTSSPLVSSFSYKSVVPLERPASTPLTPIANVFNSRPASPTKSSVPLKPSNRSTNGSGHVTPTAKVPLPKANSASPKDVASFLSDHKVLLIDVRTRAQFDAEHIKAEAVVCLEPYVLERQNVNSETLEVAMAVAPKHETIVFENRDKFDCVVIYDQASRNYSDNPVLDVLFREIYEKAIKKMLKHVPILLIGGLDAWKRERGDSTIVRGINAIPETPPPQPRAEYTAQPGPLSFSSPPNNPRNPFYQNGALMQATPLPPQNGTEMVKSPRIPDYEPFVGTPSAHRPQFSLDSGHSRMPAEVVANGRHSPDKSLVRRPAISYPRTADHAPSHSLPQSAFTNIPSPHPIQYPQPPRRHSPPSGGFSSGSQYSLPTQPNITSPPVASINPSPLRRDYIDQTPAPISTIGRGPFDPTDLRPPPAAASSSLERSRRIPPPQYPSGSAPVPPRIPVDWPVPYWADIQVGTSGLKNLGNTCYMNAPIQCLSATVPFARFFTEGRWKSAVNAVNPLGSKGRLTSGFAKLVHEMWGGDLPYLTPIDFRKTITNLKSQYIGSDQHDSQEFLSFLLDGIHEDLNRIIVKPPTISNPQEEEELERLPVQIGSEREWRAWKARNDSIIVDFFQGQFQSRLECKTCHKTSTTYNAFSVLQLPIPKSGKVSIERCMEAFFKEETLERDNAWDCPRCKTKRTASKKLSLARLPPVLVIHFKRFEANGRFSDKIDTFVDFPMKALDLTSWMPASGMETPHLAPEDPRTQLPPFKYDLYGVTNHYGNLSSGHYTAFIASRGGWLYCDDSSVKSVDAKQVVNQKAYVLFYKRTRT